MLIRPAQIEALGSPHKAKFIEKTITFLRESIPEWAESKNDDQVKTSIESILEIGKERNIKKEINIQKLLYHWIKYDLNIPPSQQIDTQLVQDGLSEDYRVKCMIKAIRKNGIR